GSGSRAVSSAARTISVRAYRVVTGAVMPSSCPRDRLRAALAQHLVRAGRAGLGGHLVLGRHLDAVESGGVQAEDLLLARDTQLRELGVLLAVRHLPVDEALHLPLRLPYAVVACVRPPVRSRA